MQPKVASFERPSEARGVLDFVGNHKSASPSSLKSAFSGCESSHHNNVGVSNEKRFKSSVVYTIIEKYILNSNLGSNRLNCVIYTVNM